MTSLAARLAMLLPRRVLDRLVALRKSPTLLGRALTAAAGPLRGREVVIAKGEGAGLRFDTTGSPVAYGLGLLEPDVQAVLAAHLRPGDTFYDVGANVGLFTLIGARRVAPGGRVVAFEPAPGTARILRRNLALNGYAHVDVRERAVADAPGTARFVVPDENQQGRLPAYERAFGPEGDSIDVAVTTLDAEIAGGAPPPTFVKMDIEGAEVAALAGMAETLRAHRPVVLCEVHETGPEVEAAFMRAGYAVERLGAEAAPGAPAPHTYHVLAHPVSP